MKRSTRMLMMASGNRGSGARNEYNGSAEDRYGGRTENRGSSMEYGGARGEYDGYAEDRFRDRRGREHYDNGRFAPMRGESEMWIEGRFRDRDGREHYDNGRFAPMRNGYDGGAFDNYGPPMHYPYPMTPYVPPIYQERGRKSGSSRKSSPINKIGFSLAGEADRIPDEFGQDYQSRVEHRNMNEMEYRRGGERMAGYGMGDGYIPFTKEIAEEWTSQMENEDGTKGPHWTMEQTKQVMAQRGIECDPLEFYAILNAVYSDYCKVAKKHNVNTIDFYSDFAKAWLNDSDAVDDKASAYYEYVVKH